MKLDAEEVSRQALSMSASERARLADALLTSLDEASSTPDEIETAWATEIGRRVDEIAQGRGELISADDVFAETRRLYHP